MISSDKLTSQMIHSKEGTLWLSADKRDQEDQL